MNRYKKPLGIGGFIILAKPNYSEYCTLVKKSGWSNAVEGSQIKSIQLFTTNYSYNNIKQSLYHMFRAIIKTHPKIGSRKIIRSTFIVEWLKTKDIRIIQYMAGYRWVSSTERYNVFNLQELKDSLKKHHPLK